MTSKLSQLLQNLLAAPNRDVADPEALTKQAQAEFNQGVVEAIEELAALSVPPLQTSAPAAIDLAPTDTGAMGEDNSATSGPDSEAAVAN